MLSGGGEPFADNSAAAGVSLARAFFAGAASVAAGSTDSGEGPAGCGRPEAGALSSSGWGGGIESAFGLVACGGLAAACSCATGALPAVFAASYKIRELEAKR